MHDNWSCNVYKALLTSVMKHDNWFLWTLQTRYLVMYWSCPRHKVLLTNDKELDVIINKKSTSDVIFISCCDN